MNDNREGREGRKYNSEQPAGRCPKASLCGGADGSMPALTSSFLTHTQQATGHLDSRNRAAC
jgi:hypothetical protein